MRIRDFPVYPGLYRTMLNSTCDDHSEFCGIFEYIAKEIGKRGWCVIPEFISADKVTRLRNETLTTWRNGHLCPAGIGQGTSYQVSNDIRSDHIKWLDDNLSTGQQYYLAQMEQLRLTINHELYLGLFSFECHQTIYPPGSYYRKHLDQFRNNNSRALTTILYLNSKWRQQDGGELILYLNRQHDHEYEIIRPLGGQLVCFLSDAFPHEVKPAHRERISIAGWFSRRDFQH